MSGIHVSEIFGPTVQGEGPLIGRPTVFVRTGGCDYRCGWCDTLFAVLPEFRHDWPAMGAEEILAKIDGLTGGKPILVTLSGGNPAIQPLEPLIDLGHGEGYRFAMETQGSVPRPWFAKLDHLMISPKPPSSGMTTDWSALKQSVAAAGEGPAVALKIVLFDERDYQFARDVGRRFPHLPVFLQVGNDALGQEDALADEQAPARKPDEESLKSRFRWIVERVVADHWHEATVLPQLHVWAWGNKRGV